MIDKYIKQNEGVLIQVIPNFATDNKLVDQLVSLVHDISDNKMKEILKHKKNFLNIKKIRKNIKTIFEICTRHPNIISYEVYSDFKVTCFNFWIPKHLSKNFIKKIYSVWDGTQIKIYEKDYIDFDISKTTFTNIRFSNHSILPLNVGKDNSPIPNLINHLESLELEEKVLIQFILKPTGTKWQPNALNAYKRLKRGEQLDNSRFKEALYKTVNGLFSSLFKEETEEDIFQKDRKIKFDTILNKISQRGINMNVRVAVESESKERSETLINGILNAFRVMEGDEATFNTFIRQDLLPLQSKEKFHKFMKERRKPIITLNNKDILITEELTRFLHQPEQDVNSNKLNRVNFRQTFIPDDLKRESGLRLGEHSYKGEESTIYWDIDDIDTLMRPVVSVANPGEGKSEMLINKFLDWVNLGYGAAVVDVADGKVIDKILNAIPAHLKDKVVLIDCNDTDNPPGLSDFSEAKSRDRTTNQMLSQLWTEFYINYFGIDDHHRSKDFIRKSSIPIFSFEENTILEQYLMISSEEFRNEFLEKMKNVKRLFKYWVWWNNFNAKPIKVKNEEVKAVLNKFDVLMDNGILKNIICQKDPKIPKFRDLMDDTKIVLIKAGEGALHYEASRIIGALTLMKFWMAALSRHDLDEEERIPFKIFCDEPQNYIASGNYIEEMLAKSRKYRLGLEFYFQDPIQIENKDKNLLKLLIGMNPHLILGKMGNDEYKKYFKERIFPILPNEGAVLPKYHWIVSMYKDKNAVPPFIVKAVDAARDPDKAEIAARKPWINELKLRYTRPAEIVETDIDKREMIGYEFDGDEEEDKPTIRGNAATI